MTSFYLSLGSNLGDRRKNIEKAIEVLPASETSVILTKISPFYETEPTGVSGHPWYINACVSGGTNLDPLQFLHYCQAIEDSLGRDRSKQLAPRPLDIDILFFNSITLESPELIIPHPRLHLRRFVLRPFNDIAPDFSHPVFKKTISELLKECMDKSIVRPF